ncbi:MAG TPA: DegT/DnrJ/EryC1/StrS family aminotransferase, partial [Candidatus Limnocylindrales bacterium]|nr:DegT/DnrJ/EryC1/StrS family aminotransferase [Candidatus Limnocylindrales bacterium]
PRPIGSIGRRLALRMAVFSEPGQSRAEIAGGDVDLAALHPALAAAARAGVERAAANRSHRLWAVERYVERLGDLVPAWAVVGRPYVRMPIIVDDAAPVTARLRAAGLDLGPRWFDAPVHPTGSRSSYVPGSAPIAESLSRRILSLPTHPLIRADDIDEIAQVILSAPG